MTLPELQKSGLTIFNAVVGSHAYGTNINNAIIGLDL